MMVLLNVDLSQASVLRRSHVLCEKWLEFLLKLNLSCDYVHFFHRTTICFFSSCSFQTDKQYVSDFAVWLHSTHILVVTWKQQQQQMAAIVLPFLCCGAEHTGRSLYLHPSYLCRAKGSPLLTTPLVKNRHALPLFIPPPVAGAWSLFYLTPLHPSKIFITDNIHGKYWLSVRCLISLEV